MENMLAYDAYYRYFMGDKPTLMSATEWGPSLLIRTFMICYRTL